MGIYMPVGLNMKLALILSLAESIITTHFFLMLSEMLRFTTVVMQANMSIANQNTSANKIDLKFISDDVLCESRCTNFPIWKCAVS